MPSAPKRSRSFSYYIFAKVHIFCKMYYFSQWKFQTKLTISTKSFFSNQLYWVFSKCYLHDLSLILPQRRSNPSFTLTYLEFTFILAKFTSRFTLRYPNSLNYTLSKFILKNSPLENFNLRQNITQLKFHPTSNHNSLPSFLEVRMIWLSGYSEGMERVYSVYYI